MPFSGEKKVVTILCNCERKWNPGWSLTSFAGSSDQMRIFLLNTQTGKMQVRNVNNRGQIVKAIQYKQWSSGWTIAKYFISGRKFFLFLLKESTGEIQVREVEKRNEDEKKEGGEIAGSIQRSTWSTAWTHAEFYVSRTDTFLLLSKQTTGDVHVHEINRSGKVGTRITTTNWGSGWTIVKFFNVNGSLFWFLLNEQTGKMQIRSAENDSNLDSVIHQAQWSSDWTSASFYRSAGNTYLLLLKKSTGRVHIHLINSDGSVGERIQRYDWSAGWSNVDVYRTDGDNYLSLLKTSDGTGHLHKMNEDGSVGERIDPKEPRTKQYYEKLMTQAGTGEELLLDYFADMSGNRVSLQDSFVSGWHTIPGSWEDLKNKGRYGQIQAGIETARQNDVPISATDYIFVYMYLPPESNTAGNGVLGHPETESLEFVTHEILHLFNIHHSYSIDGGVYDDPFDIMSALASRGFSATEYSQRGPGMNIFNRTQLGWLDTSTIFWFNENSTRSQSVNIHSLSNPNSPSPIGARVQTYPGEYYSIELRTKEFWDRGFDTSVSLIHLVTALKKIKTFNFVDEKFDSNLTSCEYFQLGGIGDAFCLVLNATSGLMQVSLVHDDGVTAHAIQHKRWSTGWSSAKFFTINQKTYLILLKAGDGSVHIHALDPTGAVGQQIADYSWSSGWTSVEFFTIGDTTYLMLLKQSDGSVHIHEMKSDGTVGQKIYDRNWSTGWTTTKFYQVGESHFLFLLKKDSGLVHVHNVNTDGTIGAKIQTLNWTTGWTTADFYGSPANPLVFLLKSSDGTAHINPIKTNGKIGPQDPVNHFTHTEFSNGWDICSSFSTRDGRYLSLLKSSTGRHTVSRLSRSYLYRDTDIDGRPPLQKLTDTARKVSIKTVTRTQTAKVIFQRL